MVQQCEIRLVAEAGRYVREIARPQHGRAGRRSTRCSTACAISTRARRSSTCRTAWSSIGEIEGRLRDVGVKVAAASATFYAIQIYTPPVDATAPGLAPDWEEDRRMRGEGLDYLAGVSGGALFRPASGLGTVSARIARETSARYALGFQMQPAERDGKRHDIKVALRRERGVTVRHRTQFVAEHPGAAHRPRPGDPRRRAQRAGDAAGGADAHRHDAGAGWIGAAQGADGGGGRRLRADRPLRAHASRLRSARRRRPPLRRRPRRSTR